MNSDQYRTLARQRRPPKKFQTKQSQAPSKINVKADDIPCGTIRNEMTEMLSTVRHFNTKKRLLQQDDLSSNNSSRTGTGISSSETSKTSFSRIDNFATASSTTANTTTTTTTTTTDTATTVSSNHGDGRTESLQSRSTSETFSFPSSSTPHVVGTTTIGDERIFVKQAKDIDILIGRGKPYQIHPGNQYMRELVAENKDLYNNSHRDLRKAVALNLLEKLTRNGARFLKRCIQLPPNPYFLDDNDDDDCDKNGKKDKQEQGKNNKINFTITRRCVKQAYASDKPVVVGSASSTVSSSTKSYGDVGVFFRDGGCWEIASRDEACEKLCHALRLKTSPKPEKSASQQSLFARQEHRARQQQQESWHSTSLNGRTIRTIGKTNIGDNGNTFSISASSTTTTTKPAVHAAATDLMRIQCPGQQLPDASALHNNATSLLMSSTVHDMATDLMRRESQGDQLNRTTQQVHNHDTGPLLSGLQMLPTLQDMAILHHQQQSQVLGSRSSPATFDLESIAQASPSLAHDRILELLNLANAGGVTPNTYDGRDHDHRHYAETNFTPVVRSTVGSTWELLVNLLLVRQQQQKRDQEDITTTTLNAELARSLSHRHHLYWEAVDNYHKENYHRQQGQLLVDGPQDDRDIRLTILLDSLLSLLGNNRTPNRA